MKPEEIIAPVYERRKLLTGVGVGALLAGVMSKAEADQAFTSFAYPGGLNTQATISAGSSTSPTSRTTPTRVGDYINVRDFGAVGDGSTDDHDAIMAAFNWSANMAIGSFTGNSARGIIYFPPGNYHVGSSLDLTYMQNVQFAGLVSFVIQGCGDQSKISGNFADYIIKRAPPYYSRTVGLNSTTVSSGTAAGAFDLNYSGGVLKTLVVGQAIVDTTGAGRIPAGTVIASIGAITVTMSAAAIGGGVVSGDTVTFAPTTTSATAAGNSTLNFSTGTPAHIVAGMAIVDLTGTGRIATTAIVTAVGATTVTMSTPAIGSGVSSGDQIKFTEQYAEHGEIEISNLTIVNSSSNAASGGIAIWPNTTGLIYNCAVGGVNCIVLQGGQDTLNNGALFDFTFTIMNCNIGSFGKSVGGGGLGYGVGIAMCQGCQVIGCDIGSCFIGISCYGTSNVIIGGRIEECDTAIKTGIDIYGNSTGNTGFSLIGGSYETSNTTLDMSHGTVCATVHSCDFTSLDGFGVDGIVLPDSSGTRVTFIACEVVGGFSGYAIRCPANSANVNFYRAFISTSATNTSSASRLWEMPAKPLGSTFISCNNPDPIYTYANLPSGNDGVGNPLNRIGDTYWISDGKASNCTDTTCTTWNTAVTGGGGSLKLKVTWNDTGWVLSQFQP